jgi:hypothetical protein
VACSSLMLDGIISFAHAPVNVTDFIPIISWQSVLLVEETGVPRENTDLSGQLLFYWSTNVPRKVDRRGCDHMVVEFTTTCAVSVYHHGSCEFEFCSGEVYSIQHYMMKFCQWLATGLCFLWVLRFPKLYQFSIPIEYYFFIFLCNKSINNIFTLWNTLKFMSLVK